MVHISLSCAVLSAMALAASPNAQDPPGLVLVKGGRTIIGSDQDEVEDFVRRFQDARGSFAGETPKHKVEVADFYLMPTEVTNEQYAAFVKATGGKPPYYWGEEALVEGLKEFQAEQAKIREEAKAEGKRVERIPFDKQAWWHENWEGKDWAVPEGQETTPVVLVTYRDVVAYCDWAGLRPMTEFEYQRAARGDTEDLYPWGPEYSPTMAATRESGRDAAWPVGSFPKGARHGIFDLSGNVWEWTSSPYVAFPKNKSFKVKSGEKKGRDIIALANFDPNHRVTVGGGFVSDAVPCRVTTRMNAMRSQSTQGLGFRCAASVTPGVDLANQLMRTTVKLNVLPPEQDVEFYTDGPVVKQRWLTGKTECKVPGYAVIEGYDSVLFVPALSLPVLNLKTLRDDSAKDGPLVLGYFSTTHPTLEPALEAGTYFVAFRGEGKLPKKEENEEEGPAPGEGFGDFTTLPGFSPDEDTLLFYDMQGVPVASMPSGPIREAAMRESSTISVAAFVPPPPPEDDDEEVEPVVPMDDLNLKIGVAGRRKTKGFWFDVQFKIKPNTILDW